MYMIVVAIMEISTPESRAVGRARVLPMTSLIILTGRECSVRLNSFWEDSYDPGLVAWCHEMLAYAHSLKWHVVTLARHVWAACCLFW